MSNLTNESLTSFRFAQALAHFDAENAGDPNQIEFNGQLRPRELAYAEWLTDWVLRLSPRASEPLLLAARSQHICRWMFPRNSYEMTRAGYLQWRAELKRFHAEKAGTILREVGYGEEVIERVRALNLKQNPAADPECQTLEDALCLVTLQYQLAELLAKTGPEKLVGILRKTWRKMSPPAHQEALRLTFPPEQLRVIEQALELEQ